MSTYDDRLAALEQKVTTLTHDLAATQGDFSTHLRGYNRSVSTLNKVILEQEMDARDIQHNMTILLGVAGSQGLDIKAIKADVGDMKVDLDAVKTDVGDMKVDLDAVKEDIGTVKSDIAALETRMIDGFKQILTVIDLRLPPAA